MNTIQISCLGKLGRFGNQLHQYAFAKAYARAHDAILETPEWIGQQLFQLSDPPISRQLPQNKEMDKIKWGKTNIDLLGHFQFQKAIDLYSKADVQCWFNFKPEIQGKYRKHSEKAVAHLRRTDYLKFKNVYCIVSEQSYVDAFLKLGIDPDQAVWVSDENQKSTDPLKFLEDFFTMMDADILLRSNSTFSWWAGALGTCDVYSPLVNDKVGDQTVNFVKGNWPKIADPRNNQTYKTIVTDLHLK